jgi:hypothetical protein
MLVAFLNAQDGKPSEDVVYRFGIEASVHAKKDPADRLRC